MMEFSEAQFLRRGLRCSPLQIIILNFILLISYSTCTLIRDGFQVPIFLLPKLVRVCTHLGEELGSQQVYVDGGMQLHAEALGPVHLPGSAKWAMDAFLSCAPWRLNG